MEGILLSIFTYCNNFNPTFRLSFTYRFNDKLSTNYSINLNSSLYLLDKKKKNKFNVPDMPKIFIKQFYRIFLYNSSLRIQNVQLQISI